SKSGNVVAQARQNSAPSAPLSKRLWENIKSLGGAVLIYLVIRQLLMEAFRIPSGSMMPTLLVGDWLFVNKAAYGPSVPFTQYHLPGYTSPKRGDVVVFVSPPQDPSIRIAPDEVTPTLVKRVVGAPGDTLLMRHGQLTVNGTVVPPISTYVLPDSFANESKPIFEWQHRIEITGSRFGPPVKAPSLHEWGPIVVPAGMFFMMGDNRDDSVDSRYYGLVPRTNIRGTPMFVYYSYVGEGSDRPLPFITDIRWSRLGHWIR
ncbi:MAG TPA: signal peptidase I, partial [Gemmatimonadaceae bacterium]